MNSFIKVKSLINLPDSRGDIKKDQIGKTSSLTPHSNGLYPVWFHKDSHPVFLKPEEFSLCYAKNPDIKVKLNSEKEVIYIVEGDEDLLKANEAGIKNVIKL